MLLSRERNDTMSQRTPEWWCSTSEVKTGLGERAIRSGRAASVSQIIRALLDLGATLVLARLLLPSDFGLVGMVAAITGFLALFNDLGLATVTVQREDLEPRDVSALFWLNTLLGAALSLLTFAVAPLIAWYYGEPELTPIARLLGVSFFLTGITVQHRALLRRRLLNLRLAVVDVMQLVVGIAAGLYLALEGAGPWALAARSAIGAAAGVFVTFLACDFRPKSPFQSEKFRELIKSGTRLAGFSVVGYVSRNFDNVLIGRYVGPHALGLYAKAYDLLLLPLRQIGEPAGSIAVPSLSRVADEPARYRQAFLRILEQVLLLSVPLGAFLMAASDAVIVVVLGPRWSGAAPIFFWLGWLTLSQPLGNACGWLFVSQGRTSELLRWGVIGAVLAVASFVVGLPWGAEGVAIAYSMSGLFVRLPIVLFLACRRGPVRVMDVLRTAAPITMASLVALAVALLARRGIGPLHPVATLAGSAVVCVGVTLLGLLPFAAGRRALSDLAMIAGFRRSSVR